MSAFVVRNLEISSSFLRSTHLDARFLTILANSAGAKKVQSDKLLNRRRAEIAADSKFCLFFEG